MSCKRCEEGTRGKISSEGEGGGGKKRKLGKCKRKVFLPPLCNVSVLEKLLLWEKKVELCETIRTLFGICWTSGTVKKLLASHNWFLLPITRNCLCTVASAARRFFFLFIREWNSNRLYTTLMYFCMPTRVTELRSKRKKKNMKAS